jgi:hypothetical protein
MEQIEITVTGTPMNFERARALAQQVAVQEGEEPMLISWCDREQGIHSPQCLQCEIKGEPGWEVYGRNHGGRVRVSVNRDCFVFIYA